MTQVASEFIQQFLNRYFPSPSLSGELQNTYLMDEDIFMKEVLLPLYPFGEMDRLDIHHMAVSFAEHVREKGRGRSGIENFLQEYSFTSEEGVLIMCLAEALLRIPDQEVARRLITEKVQAIDWQKHLGHSNSWLINASTWGMLLTGRMVNIDHRSETFFGRLGHLIKQVGQPVAFRAIQEAMSIVGQQFVVGETLDKGLRRIKSDINSGISYSFDMLGEEAMTWDKAIEYRDSYQAALDELGKWLKQHPQLTETTTPSISIKLSALHPRFESDHQVKVMESLCPVVLSLVVRAKSLGVAITIDAEEASRLELTLKIFQYLILHEDLDQWHGLGIAVQAYQKRALSVIQWVVLLARKAQKRIPVRLVKGAYWDTEIKYAQEQVLDGYPVFTRKTNTDINYLICAKKLLNHRDVIYPQFATHNAHTVAAIFKLCPPDESLFELTESSNMQTWNGCYSLPYEMQRLHGMGDDLYQSVHKQFPSIPIRVYAPIGAHEKLLPYLVRRLLENGANTSFMHHIYDPKVALDDLVTDPHIKLSQLPSITQTNIVLPANIFGGDRGRLVAINRHQENTFRQWLIDLASFRDQTWQASPLVGGDERKKESIKKVFNPADHSHCLGEVSFASEEDCLLSLEFSLKAVDAWRAQPIEDRYSIIRLCGDLLEKHKMELMALCVFEAGKTPQCAQYELLEAIDFCRYYCEQSLSVVQEKSLPGITGEQNSIRLMGRGVFCCISPWNFPIAIFTGQIVAALVCGNAVIAKPASLTTLVAMRLVQIFHEAGVPPEVLHLLPASGTLTGETIVSDERLSGIAFTGSLNTAQQILKQRSLCEQAMIPVIAETGGINAMIVDSSALIEQVTQDVMVSAFDSAGQRCSALRLLYIQEDIYEPLLKSIGGAMATLKVGNPFEPDTDVGPVISEEALNSLQQYLKGIPKEKIRYQSPISNNAPSGYWVAPTCIEVESGKDVDQELFGPLLHVVSFKLEDMDQIIEEINSSGYGLTLGVHSRIDAHIEKISQQANVGNIYVNRSMIGAMVGAQPFGGRGLSGSGPKAGGPNYLYMFCVEKTISNNVTAIGGNPSLFEDTSE